MDIAVWAAWIVKKIRSFISGSSMKIDISSPKSVITNQNTTNGANSLIVKGDKNHILINDFDPRKQARDAFNSALQDLKYNGPYVGTPTTPFKIDGIRKILDLTGVPALNEEDRDVFEKYYKNAGICSGGQSKINPGWVQGQRETLIPILERYIKNIIS